MKKKSYAVKKVTSPYLSLSFSLFCLFFLYPFSLWLSHSYLCMYLFVSFSSVFKKLLFMTLYFNHIFFPSHYLCFFFNLSDPPSSLTPFLNYSSTQTLSVYHSICLSVYLSIYLSIYIYIYIYYIYIYIYIYFHSPHTYISLTVSTSI